MMRVREFASVAAIAMIAMGGAVGFHDFQSDPALRASAENLLPNFVRPVAAAQVQPPKPVRIASAAQIIQLGVPTPPVPIPPTNGAAPAAQPPIAPAPAVQTDEAYLQADAVAERVHESVPSDVFRYFDMFLYVSKSADGAWAQHMFVFHKARENALVFEEAFPVSTGRERQEKYFTTTPTGLFELDPDRFDRNHRSHRWHNAPMPWAMFLDYTIHGHLAGVALHSGIGHVADLGHRASGGCVRMPPERAEYYFKRFQASEYGRVPVFAFDGSTTSVDGRIERDAWGNPVTTGGYRVLLIIQNYPGGPALVAMLS